MKILFVGAHPDDIEIGCGVLIASCVQAGWDIRFLIIGDHSEDQELRKQEQFAALVALGIPSPHVTFMGQPDGQVSVTKANVTAIRQKFTEWTPDIVVCHSDADGHQDHRATNELARGAFRKCHLLLFSVFLSAESTFDPKLLLSGTPELWETKANALKAFSSQTERLAKSSIKEWEESYYPGGRYEAFGLITQASADPATLKTLTETLPFREIIKYYQQVSVLR